MCPAYVKAPHLPEPTHGALDRTAELLAKLLSGSEDPDVTALSEAVKAKLGITEPLPKPALASPSPGLSTLADDLLRSRVSRLLPKVTCPSPFIPRARTVPIAELQDVAEAFDFVFVLSVSRDRSRRKIKNQEEDAQPEKIKRKIVFSDLRNPPKSFTPLFGEVAKFRTLTKTEEQ